jgi:hypothetical protein
MWMKKLTYSKGVPLQELVRRVFDGKRYGVLTVHVIVLALAV